jgi:hypothetical protein
VVLDDRTRRFSWDANFVYLDQQAQIANLALVAKLNHLETPTGHQYSSENSQTPACLFWDCRARSAMGDIAFQVLAQPKLKELAGKLSMHGFDVKLEVSHNHRPSD